jgi:hypothetical protein
MAGIPRLVLSIFIATLLRTGIQTVAQIQETVTLSVVEGCSRQ